MWFYMKYIVKYYSDYKYFLHVSVYIYVIVYLLF